MHSIFSTAALFAAVVAAKSNPVVVNAVNDVKYVGVSDDNVDQYLNIKFAEDTSGKNRFEPPKPFYYEPGSTVQATAIGPSCPQATKGAIPAMVDIPYQSEDCLNLRIAKPSGQFDKPLPVMVYIYGGGSILGSIYDDFFTPPGLVNQAVANGEPVIYVAMNYRIGVFGFAAADYLRDNKALNIGLRDQYAGLEWVRDNIHLFGGDPSQVTIFGQSFGGISVGLQLTAYGGERPALFSKAIMTSGAISGDRSDKFTKYTTGLVADELKCTKTQGLVDKEAIDCMKKVPIETIAKLQLDIAVKVKGGFGFAAYPPVTDGDFIPELPDVLLAKGRFLKNIPLIVTWMSDDGSFSVNPPIETDQQVIDSFKSAFPDYTDELGAKLLELYPESEFVDEAAGTYPNTSPQFFRASRIQRDIDPTCPLLIISRALYKYGQQDVFVGELNETRLGPYWHDWDSPLGRSHLSDVPYFFNEHLPPPADNGPEAMALSAIYSGSFSAFASTGSPVLPGKTTFQDWPRAYAPGTEEFKALVIGGPFGTKPASSGSVASAHGEEQVAPSTVDIKIQKGEQVILDAMLRTGSFAANAKEHQSGLRGKTPGLPRRHGGGISSTFADEKLVERCEFIYAHRP